MMASTSYTPKREDQSGENEFWLPGDEKKLEDYMIRHQGAKTAATRIDVRASSNEPAHHFLLIKLDAPMVQQGVLPGQKSALDAIKIDRCLEYDSMKIVNYQEYTERHPCVVSTFACAWWQAGNAPSGLPPESHAAKDGGPGADYIIACVIGLFLCPPLGTLGLLMYPSMYQNHKVVEREYRYNKDARVPYLYDVLLAFHQRSKATDYPPILKVGKHNLPVGDNIFFQQCQQFSACLWRQLGKSHSYGIHSPVRVDYDRGDRYSGREHFY